MLNWANGGNFLSWNAKVPDHMTTFESLAYRIEGATDGGTVVFIHGWPDDDSLWREQITALAGIADAS